MALPRQSPGFELVREAIRSVSVPGEYRMWVRSFIAFGMLILEHSSVPGQALIANSESKAIQARKPDVSYKQAVKVRWIPGARWTGDLRLALRRAQRERKRVFIELTAGSNLNCQLNHRAILSLPEARKALQKYVLVMLYVDVVPAEFFSEKPTEEQQETEGTANYRFEGKAFGVAQIPLYVVVKPVAKGKFETVAFYREGRIKKKGAFLKFLHNQTGGE